MSDDDGSMNHLSAERLASFIDGRLTTTERDLALAHFDRCADCRREMTDGRRVLALASPLVRHPGLARRTTRRLLIVATTAMAAVVAFAVVIPVVRNGSGRPATRAPDRLASETGAPLGTVWPTEGGKLARQRDSLVWQPAGGNAEYRLTIQDATGRTVWTTSTRDTSVLLPGDLGLTTGSEYFWSVDALLADGRSTTTRAHRFTVR